MNQYSKECYACGMRRSCDACKVCESCTKCTARARCGTCRRVHSVAHAATRQSSSSEGAPKRRRLPFTAAAGGGLVTVVRNMAGLVTYYELVAQDTGAPKCDRHPRRALRAHCLPSTPPTPFPPPCCLPPPPLPRVRRRREGRRWLFPTESAALRVEQVRVKDQYETPHWVWSYYVMRESLQVDLHSTALNAVLPTHITAASATPGVLAALSGQRLWINPAFGARAGGVIETALDAGVAAVRARACTLVALLPCTPQHPWWRKYVMAAHEVHFLEHPLAFSNPFMDKDLGPYRDGFVVAVWRPGAPPAEPPRMQLSEARPPVGGAGARTAGDEPLHLQRCAVCGKWRPLPRWLPSPPAKLRCDAIGTSCASPCVVYAWYD